MEVSSPPGVSICTMTSSTPSFGARSMARFTKWALAGPTAPSSGTSFTGAAHAQADQDRTPMRRNRRAMQPL
jgi:hypothetical protein